MWISELGNTRLVQNLSDYSNLASIQLISNPTMDKYLYRIGLGLLLQSSEPKCCILFLFVKRDCWANFLSCLYLACLFSIYMLGLRFT